MPNAPDTAGARVKWAIEQSGYKLDALADEIGCTHSTLSQWQNDHTDLNNAKVRLVHAFCARTGVNPHWLVSGLGPALNSYARGGPALVLKAQELVDRRPELATTAERLLDALQSDVNGA